MVKVSPTTRVVLAALCFCMPDSADAEIRSVAVASDTEIRIKPYQAAFVVFDVVIEPSHHAEASEHALRELLKVVRLDNKEYKHGFNMNPIAVSWIQKNSVNIKDDGSQAFRAATLLYIHLVTKDYLFIEPGYHSVEFAHGAHVDVFVETPTDDEAQVIREIETLGFAYARSVMSAGENMSNDVEVAIEKMLLRFPRTSYSPELAMMHGLAKLRALPYSPGDPGFSHAVWARRRFDVAVKYIAPYCRDAIKSTLEASATLELANCQISVLRYDSVKLDGTAEKVLSSISDHLKAIEASPLAQDLNRRATSRLKTLGTVLKRSGD